MKKKCFNAAAAARSAISFSSKGIIYCALNTPMNMENFNEMTSNQLQICGHGYLNN